MGRKSTADRTTDRKNADGAMKQKTNRKETGADIVRKLRMYFGARTLTQKIGILYSVSMLLVFPLFFHDYFFDITKTKYLFFVIATLTGFTLLVLSLLIQENVSEQLVILKPASWTDYLMLAWVCVNIISCIASVDGSASVSGADARWQGLLSVFLYALAYYCMSRFCEVDYILCYIFLIPGCLNALLGVLNHFGVDPLGFYTRMKAAQIPKFLGTIGNINMYAGYMCLVFAGVFVLFLFEKKGWRTVLWGLLLVLAAFGHLVGNSDLGYAGLGVALLVLFAVSWRKKTSMPRFFFGGAIVFAAFWIFSLLQEKFAEYAVSAEGISKELLAHGGLMLVCAAACAAVGLVYGLLLNCRPARDEEGKIRNILFQVLTAAVILAMVWILAAASRLDEISAYFAFGDTWGDYRGYVWTRLWQVFRSFEPARILIGSGQGTIKTLLNDYCYEEMKEVTGVVYDAAHNEYLQYLVTTGAVGLAAYLGFLGSSFMRGFRALSGGLSEEKKVCLIFGITVAAAYAGQALFSLAQPITTPFLFLFLGWIEKAARENSSFICEGN